MQELRGRKTLKTLLFLLLLELEEQLDDDQETEDLELLLIVFIFEYLKLKRFIDGPTDAILARDVRVIIFSPQYCRENLRLCRTQLTNLIDWLRITPTTMENQLFCCI